MRIWIGVEKFAKIESAKVCVNNYTVLVGPNNSGKTFLMQLIQGLSPKLARYVDEATMETLLVEQDDVHKKYVITYENVSRIVSCINSELFLKKESIVKEIFGREIAIGKLYVDIELDENISYDFCLLDCRKKEKIKYFEKYADKIWQPVLNFVKNMDEGNLLLVNKIDKREQKETTFSLNVSTTNDEIGTCQGALSTLFESNSLFLPASRTGLLMLYREFFANKADNDLSFVVKDNVLYDKKEKSANFTQPVYEFLRFLQTFSEGEASKKKYHEELAFFEEFLIEGHISVDKQGGLSYDFKSENRRVPMYLASAMINEVVPIVLAITAENGYGRLIIDEVEASLHPQKQLELVRFLNRLNNKGMQLIISTHSDTFVSKLNNLYILAEATKTYGYEILKQFNLQKEDLILPENLFVYEFTEQKNGKFVVKEIVAKEKTGYQFDLFTESAIHLYDEAMKLGDIQ